MRPHHALLVSLTLTSSFAAGCPTSHCGETISETCVCGDGASGTRTLCEDGTPMGGCVCATSSDAGAGDAPTPRDAGALDAGPPPCVRDIDLLFEIDTSNSMVQEQALLRAELPRLVRALATGDRDGDGIQDFPAVRSLHLGIITPDLGAGDLPPGTSVPSCDPGFGDDGILRANVVEPTAGCMSSYPSGVFEFNRASGGVESVAADFACVANVGTRGCGFEQQLEAALKALSPSAPTPWVSVSYRAPDFVGGASGHGDGANAGFLRDGSLLAVTLLTDEDDCSVPDYGLFVDTDARYAGTNLNLRCTTYETALYPTTRYRDGLLQLRDDPRLLVFTAITGVPTGLTIEDTPAAYDVVLGRSDMQNRTNAEGSSLVPACENPASGVAFPARRIVSTARALSASGARTHVGSICDSSFAADIDAIIDAIEEGAPSCE